MIRRAVGVVALQGGECLLVHKVKVIDLPGRPQPVAGAWDLPKGGVVGAETVSAAALRELLEETGSDRYRLVHQFAEGLSFETDAATRAATGFTRQETAMVLAQYLGDRSDLAPQDSEIDAVTFVPLQQVPAALAYPETRAYFEHVVLPLALGGTGARGEGKP